MSERPTEEEWALLVEIDCPVSVYQHSCRERPLYTVRGRQSLGGREWIDHKHVARTAGEAIREMHEAWCQGVEIRKRKGLNAGCPAREGES